MNMIWSPGIQYLFQRHLLQKKEKKAFYFKLVECHTLIQQHITIIPFVTNTGIKIIAV